MCFFMAQNQPIKKVEKRFNAKVDNDSIFLQSDYIVGFEYLNVPIITNENPNFISTNFHWGLVPCWANEIDFRKNTLNARIETINEKASFKNVVNDRCLIIATSYFEWHWLDEKGKQKEKYQIFSQENEIFAFAGIYDKWKNNENGKVINSFSMVTTDANQTMQYVHNHKKRMPIIIKNGDENSWLDSKNNILDFSYPNYDCNILALKV